MAGRGRWLDLGRVAPLALHAAYTGVAQAMEEDAAPVLIWARADRPHISLGASQGAAAELDTAECRAAGVELVPRPLGGGTVLIDQEQYGVFAMLPRRTLQSRHQALFSLCLPAMANVLRDFGIDAEPVGATDVWANGRKIVGSGAATINRSLVFGASFLMRFDSELFVRLVHCPSPGFRDWLGEALEQGMTSWSQQAEPPQETKLAEVVRRRFAQALDCDWQVSTLAPAESAAIEEAKRELSRDASELLLAEPAVRPRRMVANGIKVNHRTYLVEDGEDEGDWLRLWLRDRRIFRVDCADTTVASRLQRCVGAAPEAAQLAVRLQASLADQTGRWAGRIDRLAADVRRLWSE